MFKTNYKFLSVALLFAICPILNLYAQKDNAGLPFNGVVRSAEEGFAAQEFRRGVQAYYRGSFKPKVDEDEYGADDCLDCGSRVYDLCRCKS